MNRPATVLQAITTKFMGPTSTRCSRIKAACSAATRTFPYDYGLSVEQNHAVAARSLAEEFGWRGEWHQGGAPGSGFVFVCTLPGEAPAFVTTGGEG